MFDTVLIKKRLRCGGGSGSMVEGTVLRRETGDVGHRGTKSGGTEGASTEVRDGVLTSIKG